MADERFGEIEIIKMKSDDPSDFLVCSSWYRAITQSRGYENGEIISHYAARFARDKPWLQTRNHSTLEDFVLSERQTNLFFGFSLAIVKLKKQKIRVLDIGGGMATWPTGLGGFSPNNPLSGRFSNREASLKVIMNGKKRRVSIGFTKMHSLIPRM
ncbi:MAG: hypothetical protein D4R83_01165 [Streptomycetaceae bacterium]|nr:MAG: hypothetical protein D4R83_01165 [Streptomycetaceae bacterium]